MNVIVADVVISEPENENEDAFGIIKSEVIHYHPDLIMTQNHSEKSSSVVWQHFGTLQDDNRHVYCIHCFKVKKLKKYQKSTSTGNLSKHLRKQHNITLEPTFVVKKEQNQSVRVSRVEPNMEGEFPETINFFSPNISGPIGDDPNVEEFLIHDINEILIQEVEKRPILYSPWLCQEKGQKHQIRRQLWLEIYESLNHLIPYDKLPKIWKNIRDRYYKIKRSLQNGTAQETRPRYRYYKLLQFLDKPRLPSLQLHQIQKHPEDFVGIKSPNSIKSQNIDNYVDELMNVQNEDFITNDEVIDLSNDTDFTDDNLELQPKRVKLSSNESPSDSEGHYDDDANHDHDQFATLTTNNNIMSIEGNIALPSISGPLIMTQEPNDTKTDFTVETLQHMHQIEQQIEQQTDRFNDQCGRFGEFVAEVMRGMTKSQSRLFQIKVIKLISECEQNA